MTIHGLYRIFAKAGVFVSYPLDKLRGKRIGVDGYLWLKGIQNKATNLTPSQMSLGGLSITFERVLRDELEKYKTYGIKPIFVFNGINCSPKYNKAREEKKFEALNFALNTRMKNWGKFHSKGGSETAQELQTVFYEYCRLQLFSEGVEQCLFKFFDENDVDYFVAPYLSWAQLVYFYRCNLIHAIHGGNELLLFAGVDKFITSINFDKGEFHFISKRSVLSVLQCTVDMFIDTAILAGCFLSDTFGAVTERAMREEEQTGGFDNEATDKNFEIALNFVRQFGTGRDVILQLAYNEKEYMESFRKVKSMLTYNTILDQKLKCRTNIHENEVPKSLVKIMGDRIKNKVYYLLSIGALSTQLLNALQRGDLFYEYPLVDTLEYRETVKNLHNKKISTLNLLWACFQDQLGTRDVKLYRLETKGEKCQTVKVKQDSLDEITHIADVATLKVTRKSTFQCIWKKVIAAKEMKVLKKRGEMRGVGRVKASVLLKFMEFVGVLKPKDASSSQKVVGLTKLGLSLQSIVKIEESFEPYLLGLVLVKDNFLTNRVYRSPQGVYKGMFSVYDKTKPNVLLISRTMCLVKVDLKKSEEEDLSWELGKSHEDLTAFQSIVAIHYSTYRELLQAIYAYHFIRLEHKFDYDIKDDVINDLPFFIEGNCLMGLMFRTLLCNEEISLEKLEEKFNVVDDVKKSLGKALQFWDNLVQLVEISFDQNIVKAFKDADEVLKQNKLLRKVFEKK